VENLLCLEKNASVREVLSEFECFDYDGRSEEWRVEKKTV